MLDLYIGYDECGLLEPSHDLTTFQSPFEMLRLVTLPMGWMNSVFIFHDNVTCILQPEIPNTTISYIDDVPICSSKGCYILLDSMEECIPDNPGICQFIWEHFQSVNYIVQHVKYCSSTFSGFKSTLYAKEIVAVRHYCTLQGQLPDLKYVDKISKWGLCKNVSEIHTFLSTIGMCCMFI